MWTVFQINDTFGAHPPACQLAGAHRLAFNLLPLTSLHPLPLCRETPSCAYLGAALAVSSSRPTPHLKAHHPQLTDRGLRQGLGQFLVEGHSRTQLCLTPSSQLGFPRWLRVKNLPANAGDAGSIPGSGGPPREGNGNPLLYPCLENPMDRGAWWATVHGVTESMSIL